MGPVAFSIDLIIFTRWRTHNIVLLSISNCAAELFATNFHSIKSEIASASNAEKLFSYEKKTFKLNYLNDYYVRSQVWCVLLADLK